METITKLIERVNKTGLPLMERYPEILDIDRKNIVYVSPFFNKQGLYRMIIPALELRYTEKYSTLITNILPEDHTKTIDDYQVKLVPDIIRYADYMVFQANGQDMESLILSIKAINPKCKIVMDIDRNYHTLNPSNYTSRKFGIERIRNLEKNVRQVDLTTYPDAATQDFYQKKCGPDLKTAILPNLLSPYQYEGIDKSIPREKPKDGKKRILVMGDQDDWDDLNSFRETIREISVRIPDSKIYVLSNSLEYENKNCLRMISYVRVEYKDLAEYYQTLWNMNPDLAIIPVKKTAFHRTYYKILELGTFGIPVVSMDEYPFNHLLTKDRHILLSRMKKSFISNVEGVCGNEALRTNLSTEIRKFITERYSFINKDMLAVYENVFK